MPVFALWCRADIGVSTTFSTGTVFFVWEGASHCLQSNFEDGSVRGEPRYWLLALCLKPSDDFLLGGTCLL